MPETDIYNNREPMPIGNRYPKRRRRRRSAEDRAFDDKQRKRRTSNSGFRRMIHLARKSEFQKFLWIGIGVLTLALVLLSAIWEFVIIPQMAEAEDEKLEYIEHQRKIPVMPESAAK
ncbi:MAG: hypothetical protein HKP10_07335 [Kiritimatiellales bacterium]|nr:hypothetical protein [Pontiella sp.]NNJ71082.1 hypothetical protein [Kiritimatiellales bacterium]